MHGFLFVLLLIQFPVNGNPSFIRTCYVKAFLTSASIIQISAVLQGKQVGINSVPQFVAERRTQILNHKYIAFLTVVTPAAALGNSQFYFCHFDCPNVSQTKWKAFFSFSFSSNRPPNGLFRL